MKLFPKAMNAQQELESAQNLVLLRKEVWLKLFAYDPYVGPLCAYLMGIMTEDGESPLAQLKRLRECASQSRRRSEGQKLDTLARAREALVEAMHEHRRSHALLRQCSQAVNGTSETPLVARKPPVNSGVFRRYLEQLRQAEAALETARQRFVARNLRLVVSIAHRYTHPFLSQADLVQEGTLGLIRAADGYDPGRGTRFSTYAAWWIKHGITRAIANHGLTIRVPANMLTLRSQLSRLEQQFIAEHQRVPSDAELAKLGQVSQRSVANARKAIMGQTELPHEGANLADEQSVDVDGVLDWPKLERAMLEHVDDLPGIEASIIRHRFPLDGRTPMTLAQLGEVHSLSRERIRQLEKRALQRMRGQMQAML